MKKIKLFAALLAALVVGFSAGRGCSRRAPEPAAPAREAPAEKQQAVWTCSMHPQIRQPKPGKCPLCGMDLIPLAPSADAEQPAAPAQLTLSPSAAALAEIETAPVERRRASVEVRLTGKVAFDETRLATVTARIPGRIDRLYADYVGMPVKPGEHLADFYSPSLVSAQQELLLAVKSGNIPGNADLLSAIRERLRLWGLSPEQIADIERSGHVRDQITFLSPIGGIVVEKAALEGLYADTGTRLFTLADMTRLWVLLDAYESDLVWLRYAQKVTFRVEADPGRTFEGTIAFISPVLDPATRTVSVRVNVTNTDGRLKPGLFVHASVFADVAGDGTAVASDLRGKWICPMHPDVLKDKAGSCDVCGMPLVKTESLGYAAPGDISLPLVIPETAPLITGARAVVYVAVPGQPGTFEGREVELGPRAGSVYLVRAGLWESERVVVSGAFKIDSSLQIQAKPSMMNPPAESPPSGGPASPPAASVIPAAFRNQLGAVLEPVLAVSAALAKDDLEAARASAASASRALSGVDMHLLAGDAHGRWMAAQAALAASLESMAAARGIAEFRAAFASLTPAMAGAARAFGPLREAPFYQFHCPMALNNRGADWLQSDDTLRNPYFGAAMLECGERVAAFPAPAPGGPSAVSTSDGGKTP